MEVYFLYFVFFLLLLGAVTINYFGYKLVRRNWKFCLVVGIPYLIISYFLWSVTDSIKPSLLFHDFTKAYYEAGRLIWENPSSLYEPNACVHGFVNLPIVAVLFTPLSYLTVEKAELLFLFIGVLALLIFIYSWFKIVGVNRPALLLVGLMAINGPLFYSIKLGNTSHILLLLLLGIFYFIDTKKELWAGVLIALVAVIKIPLLLLGLYLLLRGKWSAFIVFIVTLLSILWASILFFGWDSHLIWYQECIRTSAGKPIVAFNVQSVDGFLGRLLFDGGNVLKNWTPLTLGWNFKILRYFFLSLLIGQTLWVFWQTPKPRSPEEENLELSIFLCLALVVSPISWSHYYLFLLLPFGLYFAGRLGIPQGKVWAAGVISSILLTSLPVILGRTYQIPLLFLYKKILISHYFFGGILFLEILLLAKWQTVKSLKISEDII